MKSGAIVLLFVYLRVIKRTFTMNYIDHYAWILAGISFLLIEFDIKSKRFSFYFLILSIVSFILAFVIFFAKELPLMSQFFIFFSFSGVGIYVIQQTPVRWEKVKLELWNRIKHRD